MEFLTIVGQDYESALKQARSEYGNAVRVHTRKDIQQKQLLHSKKASVITFYLVGQSQEEASSVQQDFDCRAHLSSLLVQNAIPLEVADDVQMQVRCEADTTVQQLEQTLVDYLLKDIQSSVQLQQKYLLVLGNAGVGKTKTAVKIALHLKNKLKKRVALLRFSIDDEEQTTLLQHLSNQHTIDYFESSVFDTESLIEKLDEYDHVLIDTCGFSGRGKEEQVLLDQLCMVLGKENCHLYLCVGASAKLSDLYLQKKRYEAFASQSLVVTKLDESSAIGNILIFLRQSRLPLSFLTNGPDVSSDLVLADEEILLQLLQGFNSI